MISEYDLRQILEQHKDIMYIVGDTVYDATDNAELGSVEHLLNFTRRKLHCDFTSIYYCHGTLENVLRCNECGAIIFTTDDINGYDPNLCCPVCGGYHYDNYWSKEEIDADPEKQKAIEMYEQLTREAKERYIREKKRGLLDNELYKKEYKGKKKYLKVTLERMSRYGQPLKGLNLFIQQGHIDTDYDDYRSYVINKFTRIPLSPYAIYIYWIYPKTKKHKNFKLKESTNE